MTKKLLLLLLLCSPAYADGNYGFSDPKLNAEFENNYYEHKFGDFVNVKASSMTATFLKVSSITLNGTNLTVSSPKIVQKVTATTDTNFTTTSGSFQSTSLTVTITPTSASNKIIVWAGNASFYMATNNVDGIATIFRGATDLGGANGLADIYFNSVGSVISQINMPIMMMVEDSPATTSATIYTVKIKSNGSATLGWGNSQNQWIVAMEVTP